METRLQGRERPAGAQCLHLRSQELPAAGLRKPRVGTVSRWEGAGPGDAATAGRDHAPSAALVLL